MLEPRVTYGDAYRFLSELQRYAPTITAHQDCADLFSHAYALGASDRQVCVMILDAMREGLSCNDWPWSRAKEYYMEGGIDGETREITFTPGYPETDHAKST